MHHLPGKEQSSLFFHFSNPPRGDVVCCSVRAVITCKVFELITVLYHLTESSHHFIQLEWNNVFSATGSTATRRFILALKIIVREDDEAAAWNNNNPRLVFQKTMNLFFSAYKALCIATQGLVKCSPFIIFYKQQSHGYSLQCNN